MVEYRSGYHAFGKTMLIFLFILGVIGIFAGFITAVRAPLVTKNERLEKRIDGLVDANIVTKTMLADCLNDEKCRQELKDLHLRHPNGVTVENQMLQRLCIPIDTTERVISGTVTFSKDSTGYSLGWEPNVEEASATGCLKQVAAGK